MDSAAAATSALSALECKTRDMSIVGSEDGYDVHPNLMIRVKSWLQQQEFPMFRLCEYFKDHPRDKLRDFIEHENNPEKLLCHCCGATALHLCVREGHGKLLQALSSRLDKNMRNWQGETVLHEACYTTKATVVQTVLNLDVDPNAQDNTGVNPILIALRTRNSTLLQLLLSHGADPNVELVHCPKGDSPLHVAAKTGWTSGVRILLRKQAAPNCRRRYDGATPISLAVEGNCQDVITLLIKGGATCEGIYAKERTLLHSAVMRAGHAVVSVLVARVGASTLNLRDYYKLTALHYAVINRDLKSAEALLAAGIDVNIEDRKSRTATYLAALLDDWEMVESILKYGILNGNVIDPLQLAIQKEKDSIVKRLLGCVTDINELGRTGKSVLHVATECNNEKLVKILLNKGAIPDRHSSDSPILNTAIKVGNPKIVGMLVLRGAEIDLSDKEGVHPMDLAMKSQNMILINLLLETKRPGLEKYTQKINPRLYNDAVLFRQVVCDEFSEQKQRFSWIQRNRGKMSKALSISDRKENDKPK